MQTLNKVRLFVGLMILTVGLSSLVAGPSYQYWRTYYTNSSKTVECGYADVSCNYTYYSGCRTAYYEDEYTAPCGGGGGCTMPDNTNCRDGNDNDGDGKVDWSDPGCQCVVGGNEFAG